MKSILSVDVEDRFHILGLDSSPQPDAWGSLPSHVEVDFMAYKADRKFDYSILMGFMDYVAEPGRVVERALAVTGSKAFFSLPADGGFLSWQRKLRYRRRCDLYLYTRKQIEEVFAGVPGVSIGVEKIARDYFVTASIDSGGVGQ